MILFIYSSFLAFHARNDNIFCYIMARLVGSIKSYRNVMPRLNDHYIDLVIPSEVRNLIVYSIILKYWHSGQDYMKRI